MTAAFNSDLSAEEAALIARMRAEREVRDVGGDIPLTAQDRADLALLRAERASQEDTRQADARHAQQPPARDYRDALVEAQEAKDGEDFGAFWQTVVTPTKTLRNVVPGVHVSVGELPISFEVEARRLERDKSDEGVRRIFAMLFGETVLDRLVAGGLKGPQLQVLIIWGTANGNGRAMTLAEAVKARAEMLAAQAAGGKARAMAGSGLPSPSTGPSSNPTSRGSTRKKRGRRKR